MNKSLKTLLYSISLVAVFFCGCKKSNTGPSAPEGYYIKFKLDGIDKNYTSRTTAAFNTQTMPLSYECGMIAFKSVNGEPHESLGISLITITNPITAGITYTDALVAIGDPQVEIVYSDSIGLQSLSTLATMPNVKLIISTIDSVSIKGTFSGSVMRTTLDRAPQIITDGSFHLIKE